eukprot:TRINITY_DN1489_c0_g1_i1.p1 TRINITY_DN1489_c0_g1~~TRINITY_DN1489_c0_g1_i1.p1  ORF type:complete len:353 (+),score=48.59 TRINITY_DN1489_c0_g1_i1:100-1059(+)
MPEINLTLLEKLYCILSLVIFFIGLALTPMMFLVSLYFIMVYQSFWAFVYVGFFCLATVLPFELHAWPWYIHDNFLWKYWRAWFSFHVIVPDDYFDEVSEEEDRFLFAQHPHGIFPVGQWLSQASYDMAFPKLRYCKGVTTDSVLRAPVMRQLYGWFGVISAREEVMREQMKLYNIGLTPGGIAEMFHSNFNEEVIFIYKRRGIFRLAIAEGFDIVPGYVFGNTQIFKRLSTGRGIITALSRKLRTSISYFYGYLGIPVPFRRKILLAHGKPIKVTQNDNPTEEDIDALRERYIQSLLEIFEKYKAFYGWENKQPPRII